MSDLAVQNSKIIVHHLNNSRSQRVLWLLEELELPYEIKKWERSEQGLAPKELKAIHPLGNSPVIQDGELILAESGAIVEYLITKYGNGRFVPPAGEQGWVDNLYYTHYAEGSLMPHLVMRLMFTLIPDRSPLLVRPILRMVFNTLLSQLVEPRLKVNGKMIEDHLSKRPNTFFAGGDSPTAADFQMAFPLEAWAAVAGDSMGEHTRKFVETVHARPAYKRALEKGGRYEYA